MANTSPPPTTLEEHDTELAAKIAELDISELNRLARTLNERLTGDLRIQGTSSSERRLHQLLLPVFELKEQLDVFIGLVKATKKPTTQATMDEGKKKMSKRTAVSSEQIGHLENRIRDLSIDQKQMKDKDLKDHESQLRQLQTDVAELQSRPDAKKVDSQLRTMVKNHDSQLSAVAHNIADLQSSQKELEEGATSVPDTAGKATSKAEQSDKNLSPQQKYDKLFRQHETLVVNHNNVDKRLIELEKQFERSRGSGKKQSR